MTTILRNIFNRSLQHHEAVPSIPADEEYISERNEELQQNAEQMELGISSEHDVVNNEDENESEVENWSNVELNQNIDNNSSDESDANDIDIEMGELRLLRFLRNNGNGNATNNNADRNSDDDNETTPEEDTNVDDSVESYDAEEVYRSMFDLQEEMHDHTTRESDDEDSVRLRNIMLVTCLIPVSIFILLSLSVAPDAVPPPTNEDSNDTASDTNPALDDDGNYQLFSILFFMSFMNILCAFLERAGQANSAAHAHITIPSTSIDENGETVTAASASLHLMSFEAQLTAAILESRRVQLLELLGRTDEINPPAQNTGVSEAKRNAWSQYDFQFDNAKHDPALPPACSICLCEYEEGEKIVRLPCNHEYHESCLLSWTSSHVRCPLCNYDLENDEEGDS